MTELLHSDLAVGPLSTKISVVSSVKNEEAALPELILRLEAVLVGISPEYEVILIDNGSSDATPLIIEGAHRKNARIKLIQLSRDFGQVMALRSGIQHASGDIVVIMDGDLQDLPEEIPKLLPLLGEGWDLVYAQRKNRQDAWFRRVSSNAIRKIFAFLIKGSDMPPGDERMLVGVFRAMKREVADAIRTFPEHTMHIQSLIRWIGFKQTLVEVEHGKRKGLKSKYNPMNLIRYALDGAVAASTYPLRLVTLIGFLIAFISFAAGVGYFFQRIWYGTQLVGFTTLVIMMLFLGGANLFVAGVRGEYIGRVYNETKARPLYIIKKKLL